MARIRCLHQKAIHFSSHREPFVAGLKQCYLCWKHIFTFPFLAMLHAQRNPIHIYARIIIYGLDMQWFPFSFHSLDLISLLNCTHFSSFSLLEYFIACIQNSLFGFRRSTWILLETEEKKVRNYVFRTAFEPPTTSSANLKNAREKKGGEKKNRLEMRKKREKKSNYFWIKMVNLRAF